MRRVCLILLCGLVGSLSFLSAEDIPIRDMPSTVSNLSLWLKADEGVSFHEGEDGNVVKTWQSKVGNLEATQSVGDNRVVRSKESDGSKYTLYFRGNSTLVVGQTFNLRNSTVFVSILHGAGGAFQRIISLSRFPETATDYEWNDALAFVVHMGSGYLAKLESNGLSASAPSYNYANAWNVLGYRIDGGGNMTVTANGKDGISQRNAAMSISNTGKLLLGHSPRNIDVEKLVDARVYEILIFNRFLDADERRRVSAYMVASMNAEVPTLYERPEASEVKYGAKLSTSILSGGRVVASDNSPVIGDFKWSDPEKVLTQSGNRGVIFVPKFANYTTPIEFQVNVPVSGQPPNSGQVASPAASDNSEQRKCKKKKCKKKKAKKQKKTATKEELKTKQRGQVEQPKDRGGVPVAVSGSSVIMSDGSVRSAQ